MAKTAGNSEWWVTIQHPTNDSWGKVRQQMVTTSPEGSGWQLASEAAGKSTIAWGRQWQWQKRAADNSASTNHRWELQRWNGGWWWEHTRGQLSTTGGQQLSSSIWCDTNSYIKKYEFMHLVTYEFIHGYEFIHYKVWIHIPGDLWIHSSGTMYEFICIQSFFGIKKNCPLMEGVGWWMLWPWQLQAQYWSLVQIPKTWIQLLFS